jgi:hypothetical protein
LRRDKGSKKIANAVSFRSLFKLRSILILEDIYAKASSTLSLFSGWIIPFRARFDRGALKNPTHYHFRYDDALLPRDDNRGHSKHGRHKKLM